MKPKTHPNEPQNWSYLITKHISQGSPREALVIYTQNRRKGLYILGLLPLVLKACASFSSLDYGKLLQAESIKTGVDFDVMVGTSLVNMYAKCGDIMASRKVFDKMPERNVVTWNAMLGGYLRNGRKVFDKISASVLFEKMPGRTEVSWIEMIGEQRKDMYGVLYSLNEQIKAACDVEREIHKSAVVY